MKVLVTGAGGLIGSSIADVFSSYENIELTLTGSGWNQDAKQGDYLKGDLTDRDFINCLMQCDFDAVVHCAAKIPNQAGEEIALAVSKQNRIIDDNIIDLCSVLNSRLVFISSVSVYGFSTNGTMGEDSCLSPGCAYSREKIVTEQQIALRLKELGTSLRISSPYGAAQKNKTVMKLFVENVLNDFDLKYFGNGNRMQDFISVYDIANAVFSVLDSPNVFGVFNIAYGNLISMKQLANLVVACCPNSGSKVYSSGAPEADENRAIVYDIAKAKEYFGWFPKTDLESGIKDWIRAVR